MFLRTGQPAPAAPHEIVSVTAQPVHAKELVAAVRDVIAAKRRKKRKEGGPPPQPGRYGQFCLRMSLLDLAVHLNPDHNPLRHMSRSTFTILHGEVIPKIWL